MKRIIILLFFLSLNHTALSQGLVSSDFAVDFTKPVGFVCDPNGNFLVWEQGGKLWYVSKEGVKSPTPVLDISPEVFDMAQLGMIAVVLHPDYLNNGYIYLSYTVDLYWELLANKNTFNPSTGDTGLNGYPTCSFVRVTRYTLNTPATNPTVNLSSRTVLIGASRSGAPVTTAFSHVGGGMAFGSDGTLLVAFGCGARDSSGEAGDVGGGPWSDWEGAITHGIMTSEDNIGTLRIFNFNNYSGKVLRLDPITGNGVSSNPYYNSLNPGSALSRFWAYGFRNPFRITFLEDDSGSHHETDGNPGKFLISEVGSDLYEEINLLSGSRQFFGWPKYEGIDHLHTWGDLATRVVSDTIIKPLIEYRNSIGRSVKNDGTVFNVPGLPIIPGSSNLGGFRYLKDDLPEEYKDDILFADYESKTIFNMDLDSVLNVTSVGTFYQATDRLGYIDVNPHLDGIFYISGCGEPAGKLRRIMWEDNSIRIRAKIEASHNAGYSPNLVNFNSESTTYNGSGELSYVWDLGDGSTSNEKNIAHLFSDSIIRNYKIKLTVTDNLSNFSYDSTTFYLNAVSPEILSTSIDSLYMIPENADTTINLNFNSNVTIPDAHVEWRLALCHNGHEHIHAIKHGNYQTVVIPATMCDQGGATYWYKIYLEVKNSFGLKTEKVQNVYFDCISGIDQSITFNDIPDQNYGITDLPLDATASSGLGIEYFVSKGKANIHNSNIVFSPGALGEIKIIATQKGGSGFKQAIPIERAFKIQKNPCTEYFSITKISSENKFESYNSGKFSKKIFNVPVSNDKNTFSLRAIEFLPGFEYTPETGFIKFSAKDCL